jgi:3D (Asp-Asp-Asp) domain-containing protein
VARCGGVLTALVLGGLVAVTAVASAKPLRKPTWVRGVTVSEYYSVPEAWFSGKRVKAPGLPGRHRIDWLYSARGLSMEGDGIGLDGKRYHIASTGNLGWVTELGRSTIAARGWLGGSPFWRAGGFWRGFGGRVTFPLERGGWYAGVGRRYVEPTGISFGQGPSRPLQPYASIAVDPALIPLGSIVYIPAYGAITPSAGWFRAQDVGGAIKGRRIDVFRPPPASMSQTGRYMTGQRIRVYPPGSRLPSGVSLKPAKSTFLEAAPQQPRVAPSVGGGTPAG